MIGKSAARSGGAQFLYVAAFFADVRRFLWGYMEFPRIKSGQMSKNNRMKKRVLPADEARTRDERESCFPAFSAEEGKYAARERK